MHAPNYPNPTFMYMNTYARNHLANPTKPPCGTVEVSQAIYDDLVRLSLSGSHNSER